MRLVHDSQHSRLPFSRELVQLFYLLAGGFRPLLVPTVHGFAELEQELDPQLPQPLPYLGLPSRRLQGDEDEQKG